ncbi:MAG: hypothetical protein M0Z85_11940, partial [Gammaproteobacteria bacterium]|nr:hypothetical protein [Gammaproteobacteria bacterium]
MAEPFQQSIKVTLITEGLDTEFAALKAKVAEEAKKLSDLLSLHVNVGASGPSPSNNVLFELGRSYPGTNMSPPLHPGPPASTGTATSPPFSGSTRQMLESVPQIPELERALFMLGPVLPKPINQLPLAGQEADRYAISHANALSNRAERAYARNQTGGRVSGQELAYLRSEMADTLQLMREQRQQFLLDHPPSDLVSQSSTIAMRLSDLYTLPESEQQKRWNTEIAPLRKAASTVGSQLHTIDAYTFGETRLQQSLSNLPESAPPAPSESQPAPSGLSPFDTVATYTGRAAGALSKILPMYSSLLGAGALGASYQFASNLAVESGSIGMQAGGASPNKVYHDLLTQGKALGFSPSELAQSVQAQGAFSGDANIAILFKDAQSTAQFARYLGIGTQAGAQLMGTYQLAGAFAPGSEASAAASL